MASRRSTQTSASLASGTGVAYGTNPVAHDVGSLLLGWVTTAGTPTVADNVGGSWTLRGSVMTNGTNISAVFVCLDMVGGATTVTPTLAGATFSMILQGWNTGGVPAISVGIVQANSTGSGSIVVNATSRLLIGYMHAGAGSGPTSCAGSPGSWTNGDPLNNQAPTGVGGCYAGLIAAEGTYSVLSAADTGVAQTHLLNVQLVIDPVIIIRTGTAAFSQLNQSYLGGDR